MEANHRLTRAGQSKSLPDISQLDKEVAPFLSGPTDAAPCGRSCSLKDAQLLRDAYSSSECDSTSSSSSSSESLSTTTSNSSDSDDSADDDDDEDDDSDSDDEADCAAPESGDAVATAAASVDDFFADLFLPRGGGNGSAAKGKALRTLQSSAGVGGGGISGNGWRPLSALHEQRESASSASSSASSITDGASGAFTDVASAVRTVVDPAAIAQEDSVLATRIANSCPLQLHL